MSALALEPLPLERLVEALRCQRLPWWRAQGLAGDREPEGLPLPWPALPPGWRLGGQGQARVVVADSEGLWGRCDWLVRKGLSCHLIALGDPTPTLRLRMRLLGALWERTHEEVPVLWFQPSCACAGDWEGSWPLARRAGVAPLPVEALLHAAGQVRAMLDSPWPPEGTAPLARCWDCQGFCHCGDRG